MKKQILFIFFIFPCILFAQNKFMPESIPVSENNEVIFRKKFGDLDLKKEDIKKRVLYYLTHELNPDSALLAGYPDKSVCRVTECFVYSSGAFQTNGMCMMYELIFEYEDNCCNVSLEVMKFMEKEEYDKMLRYLPEKPYLKEEDFKSYIAKKIMIDRNYRILFVKKASDKVTGFAIERINTIMKEVEYTLTKKNYI